MKYKIAKYKLKYKIIGTLLVMYIIITLALMVLSFESWPLVF